MLALFLFYATVNSSSDFTIYAEKVFKMYAQGLIYTTFDKKIVVYVCAIQIIMLQDASTNASSTPVLCNSKLTFRICHKCRKSF